MLLPPRWAMPASKETRVRVEGFSKIRARVLPAKGLGSCPWRCSFFSATARSSRLRISAVVRSNMVKRSRFICFYLGWAAPAKEKFLWWGRANGPGRYHCGASTSSRIIQKPVNLFPADNERRQKPQNVSLGAIDQGAFFPAGSPPGARRPGQVPRR